MYLNNLVYARGHPNDYKNWFGDTFDYEEDILKYFKKSENQQGSYKNDCKLKQNLACFVATSDCFQIDITRPMALS